MSIKPREDRATSGILMMLLAVMLFTGIDTSAKWLSIAGLPVIEIVFLRYFGHFVFATGYYLPTSGPAIFVSNAPRIQLLRSTFLCLSTLSNFWALKYLPITVTTTIAFAGPIATTLLAIPILGERVGIHRIIAVCCGFFGVLLVIQPWNAAFHPAMILSLFNLVIVSGYFITTRMIAGVERNATQQVWSSGFASLVLAPFAIAHWVWPDSTAQWLVIVALGAFGATGHISATAAHRRADASILAPVFYTQVFSATLVGIFIFDTWPTWWTLAGGAVIIGSGAYIWQRTRRKSKAPPVPLV